MTEETVFPIKRALLSVADKTGLAAFAGRLRKLGVEIIATGGTATVLRDAGITVTSVSDMTGFPEILEGRVKTLHPAIHGGILAKLDQTAHREALDMNGIAPIGLVAVNLYPFEKTAAASDDAAYIIENIDIGGPALSRAAAKNHAFVAVLSGPEDYDAIADEIEAHDGAVTLKTRKRLAAKAFTRSAAYDAAISRWFAAQRGEETPLIYAMAGHLKQKLRYGENPHQTGALYADPLAAGQVSIAAAEQVQGKELSYNNIADADAAFALASELGADAPALAIVKHANPCGVALGRTLAEAYEKALRCDPVSAFGGIVAVNQRLDEEAAEAITKIFTEVVIAPSASDGAKAVFAAKPNIRLLLTGGMSDPETAPVQLHTIGGGFLMQGPDNSPFDEASARVVTRRRPSQGEMQDLLFAFRVAKHVKSNAIVFAKDLATLGIGAGQMSRIDSVRIAAMKAEEAARQAEGVAGGSPLQGSCLASDAFFPFPDGVIAAAEAGAAAIIQPGGSVRDDEVIAAADERGIAMVFTGIRHFRH